MLTLPYTIHHTPYCPSVDWPPSLPCTLYHLYPVPVYLYQVWIVFPRGNGYNCEHCTCTAYTTTKLGKLLRWNNTINLSSTQTEDDHGSPVYYGYNCLGKGCILSASLFFKISWLMLTKPKTIGKVFNLGDRKYPWWKAKRDKKGQKVTRMATIECLMRHGWTMWK